MASVCAKFNGGITERLLDGALAGLEASGVKAVTVTVAWVPGAFELPLAAYRLAQAGGVDAVVALGAVIRGETAHFDFVAGECASGLQRVALDTGVPVVFGVLTTDTVDQALAPVQWGRRHKGYEAAVTALEMADLLRRLAGVGSVDRRAESTPSIRCCVSSCPRGRSRKRRWTCSPRPTSPWCGPRTSTTGPPSTTPASTRSASCGPRRSPGYVAEGLFDLGITGSRLDRGDRRRGASRSGELAYSKATANPIRVVLAVAQDSPVMSIEPDLPAGARVSTEYPELTRRVLEKHGVHAEIRLSYGATEAKIPDIADAVVEITETGRALAAARLRIVETLLVSRTELIANPGVGVGPRQAPRDGPAADVAPGCARGPGQGPAQAQRGRRRARSGRGGAPGAQVAHGVGALGRRAGSRWRPWCRSRRSTC